MRMCQKTRTNFFAIDPTAASRAALLAMALGCALSAKPASAQSASATRTFVASTGSDSNPCTITAPCRSLQAAVNVTAPAGEVVVLTPGGYGTVSINQSITIANDGVGTASISVPQSNIGVAIQAGSTDSVQLRGLEIDGNLAGGNTGIGVSRVGSLSIVNCVIRHTNVGIGVGSGTANIFNSVVSDQGPVVSSPGNTSATGVTITQNGTAYVTNSLLSGNGNNAILVNGGIAYVNHDTITGNGVGLRNYQGLSQNPGAIYSFQDNNISGNTTANTSGTVTSATPQ